MFHKSTVLAPQPIPDLRKLTLAELREQETHLITTILQHADSVDAFTSNLLTRKDVVAVRTLRRCIQNDMATLRAVNAEISYRYDVTLATDC